MKCNVEILHEVSKPMEAGWSLCFQYCKYHYDGEDVEPTECELGYRFIWRRPDGTLQPARGQARIPNMADIMELTALAMRAGWGNE